MAEQVQVSMCDSAVFTRVDERTGVVLELTRKRYYMLSQTAADMLEMLQRGGALALDGIVARLHEQYDIDRETLEKDVQECLADLQKRRVVALSS